MNTMPILNFGSLNLDHVYYLDNFVKPGETLACHRKAQFVGGKGLNQSTALARAGAQVFHAGAIGAEGKILKEFLEKEGVNTRFIRQSEGPSGHAIIQVTPSGQNSIIVFGGANQTITVADIQHVLEQTPEVDILVVQNEISCMPELLQLAKQRALKIALNPSPITSSLLSWPLECVDILVINETEGRVLSGQEDPEKILDSLSKKFPHQIIALTLGEKGVICTSPEGKYESKAPSVEVVDTTAAGDTFFGYFIHGITTKLSIQAALDRACRAAALCVTKAGAADSIPRI
jgi:ribokinase